VDREVLVVAALHVGDHRGEGLAERVARHPALDRGDAIGAAHWLTIVKFEPVAQHETVIEFVRRFLGTLDHLRVRLELRVDREQRVEHHVTVIAGDVGRRPDRIEHPHIGLRDEAQGLVVGALGPGTQTQAREARRPGADPEFATRHSVSHSLLHPGRCQIS